MILMQPCTFPFSAVTRSQSSIRTQTLLICLISMWETFAWHFESSHTCLNFVNSFDVVLTSTVSVFVYISLLLFYLALIPGLTNDIHLVVHACHLECLQCLQTVESVTWLWLLPSSVHVQVYSSTGYILPRTFSVRLVTSRILTSIYLS